MSRNGAIRLKGSTSGRYARLSASARDSPNNSSWSTESTLFRLLISTGLSLSIASVANAQLIDDTFEAGSNIDLWVAWDAHYNSVVGSGGHPYDQLVLNNVGGAPACDSVVIAPSGAVPFAHSGDWRAAGVRQAAIDLSVRRGRYGGALSVVLVSDPDTPNDPSDDCTITLTHSEPSPGGIGWRRYMFPVPSADAFAPVGWVAGGACVGAPIDQAWNTVIEDVDRMQFVLDAIPGVSCANTEWDLGIDNISVRSCSLGSVYCLSGVNSTGYRAQIVGVGSRVIADDDLTFVVTSLPPNSFGYFLMSEVSARMPVHAGDLCLGGKIKRFSLFVQQARQDGVIDFSLDPAALPGGSVFRPGESWNLQYWYRDTPLTNFSEAISVTFE